MPRRAHVEAAKVRGTSTNDRPNRASYHDWSQSFAATLEVEGSLAETDESNYTASQRRLLRFGPIPLFVAAAPSACWQDRPRIDEKKGCVALRACDSCPRMQSLYARTSSTSSGGSAGANVPSRAARSTNGPRYPIVRSSRRSTKRSIEKYSAAGLWCGQSPGGGSR